jgi:hypothetical protein
MKQLLVFAMLLLSTAAAVSQEPFNGLITNFDGKGIKANIVVKGSDKRTRSDGKGRFGLTDVAEDAVLQIVAKRDTIVVELNGHRSIDIVWDSRVNIYQATESEELMNYGFGYVKRRESTDFSSGISGERLRSMGTSSLADAIVKCYPGLRYINGELCLRTQNSINSSSAVLVLCDGIETNLDYINIHDVKSVEVIKSSNMYGFRGVHGVVLVTTMTAKDQIDALDRMEERGKRY